MSLEKLIVFIDFIFLIPIGLFTLDVLKILRSVDATLRWKKVEGKIIHTEIRRLFDMIGTSFYNYFAEIKYKYKVNGKIYESKRISSLKQAGVFRNRDDAKNYIESFPVGEIVTVYYNPQSPEVSVLNIGYTKEVKKNVEFEIKMILLLLTCYILIRIIDIAGVW